MAWVEGAGSTRRTGRGTDALGIQQEQQCLALDALKAEVHIARQALFPVAAEDAVGNPLQSGDQLIPELFSWNRALQRLPSH